MGGQHVGESQTDESATPTHSPECDTPGFDDGQIIADDAATTRPQTARTPSGITAMAGAAILLALGGQTAWLGFQATNVGQTARSNEEFVQVARQGALDLTNISSDSITQDVQRILDSSTGALLTDFQERSQSFAGFIQQAQSHSEATIREAGLESRSGDEAKVLVVLTVDASALGGANDNPQRTLRMRVTVQKVSGNQMKLANVEIVP